MIKRMTFAVAICSASMVYAADAPKPEAAPTPTPEAQKPLSFFVTSEGAGKGADLGGLAGADAHCQKLATAAGAGNKTWHAYLSTQAANGKPAINARDRIGTGPWFNAKGVAVAKMLLICTAIILTRQDVVII